MRRSTPWLFKGVLLASILLQFSCQKQASSPSRPVSFNQDHSYALLNEICKIGPRNHGSETKSIAEKWIEDHLIEAGADVSLHKFTYTSKRTGTPESFTNIVGRIRPSEKRRVMVGTHYDTRSWADLDKRPELRSTPIIGANDGGSGVAVMLEMARAWKDQPPPVGVDLIFFDGEDFGSKGFEEDYFVGSKAWVRDHPDFKPEWGVVMDMVGDSSLRIPKEKSSAAHACKAIRKIWAAAERVGAPAFVNGFSVRVYDDHTAFLDNKIPVALLIDREYRWFHTTEDLPDKCSAESLGQVGRAVMESIHAL